MTEVEIIERGNMLWRVLSDVAWLTIVGIIIYWIVRLFKDSRRAVARRKELKGKKVRIDPRVDVSKLFPDYSKDKRRKKKVAPPVNPNRQKRGS